LNSTIELYSLDRTDMFLCLFLASNSRRVVLNLNGEDNRLFSCGFMLFVDRHRRCFRYAVFRYIYIYILLHFDINTSFNRNNFSLSVYNTYYTFYLVTTNRCLLYQIDCGGGSLESGSSLCCNWIARDFLRLFVDRCFWCNVEL
jgi:hypothetical protein